MKVSVLLVTLFWSIPTQGLALMTAPPSNEKVTIFFGDEKKPLEISREHARFFKACTLYLDTHFSVFPLQEVSFEVGVVIVNQLEHMETALDLLNQPAIKNCLRKKIIDSETREVLNKINFHIREIKKSFARLNGEMLLAVLKALDYLDIEFLVKIARDVAGWRNTRSIDPENLAFLVMDLGNNIIQHKVALMPGRFSAIFTHLISCRRPVVTPSGKIVFRNGFDVVIGDLKGCTRRILCKNNSIQVLLSPPVSLDRDGRVFFVSYAGDTYVWDTSGNLIKKGKINVSNITSFCITNDSKLLVGSEDGDLRLYDTTGTLLAASQIRNSPVALLKTAPNNKIICWRKDYTLSIYDMQSNTCVRCKDHESPKVLRSPMDKEAETLYWENKALSTCITSDNKIIAASWDNTVKVWDMDGNILAVCKGHTNRVTSVRVLPDNKIVSGSLDGTVRIWNMNGNEQIVLKGHNGAVNALDVYRDGTIASASKDGTVRIWSENGTLLTTFREHEQNVVSVLIAPHGQIISVSENGTICIWDSKKNIILERIARVHENQAIKIWKLLQKRPAGNTYNAQPYWEDLERILDNTDSNENELQSTPSLWNGFIEAVENFFS